MDENIERNVRHAPCWTSSDSGKDSPDFKSRNQVSHPVACLLQLCFSFRGCAAQHFDDWPNRMRENRSCAAVVNIGRRSIREGLLLSAIVG